MASILFPIAQRGWQDAEAGSECVLTHFKFGPNCPHVEVGRNMHPVRFLIGFAFAIAWADFAALISRLPSLLI